MSTCLYLPLLQICFVFWSVHENLHGRTGGDFVSFCIFGENRHGGLSSSVVLGWEPDVLKRAL